MGLSAVFVAYAACKPETYGIGSVGHISKISMLEMTLGVIIGLSPLRDPLGFWKNYKVSFRVNLLASKGQHFANSAMPG